MNHSFDVDHAAKYGVFEAILIGNFQFWIAKNKANGEKFFDGRTWTYNSVNAYADQFPYLTANQVRRALERLVSAGVMVVGNYNERAMDRTKWFAFADENEFLPHLANLPIPSGTNAEPSGKSAKSLIRTDVNADRKPDSSAARGSRLPKDWVLKKAWGAEALALQPNWTPEHCRMQADKFRDYWIAVPGKAGIKLDWLATWRNWVRNAGPMPGGAATGASGTGDTSSSWWQSTEGVRERGAELGLTEQTDKGEFYRQYRVRVLKAAGPGQWRDDYLKEISREQAEHERVVAYFAKGEDA